MSETIGVESFLLSHATYAGSFKLIVVGDKLHVLATGQVKSFQKLNR